MARTPSEPAQRFLTTRQAALRLGVTINAIKAWIREDQLRALRTPGGHHRIAESDLAAFQARLAENSRGRGPSRPRILLADDDAQLLSALRETLEALLPQASCRRLLSWCWPRKCGNVDLISAIGGTMSLFCH